MLQTDNHAYSWTTELNVLTAEIQPTSTQNVVSKMWLKIWHWYTVQKVNRIITYCFLWSRTITAYWGSAFFAYWHLAVYYNIVRSLRPVQYGRVMTHPVTQTVWVAKSLSVPKRPQVKFRMWNICDGYFVGFVHHYHWYPVWGYITCSSVLNCCVSAFYRMVYHCWCKLIMMSSIYWMQCSERLGTMADDWPDRWKHIQKLLERSGPFSDVDFEPSTEVSFCIFVHTEIQQNVVHTSRCYW